MPSPCRIIPSLMMRQCVPRRPRISFRSPGRRLSICAHGVQTIVPCTSAFADSGRFPHTEATDGPWVVMFSRIIPGPSASTSRVSRSTSEIWRSSPTRVCAALKPSFLYRGNRRLFLHGPAPFQSAGDPGRRTWALVSCGLYAANVSADVLAIVHSVKMNSFRRLIYKR
jgi:hypothetical protein